MLLDIATDDPTWARWSLQQLDAAAMRGRVFINAVIYADFSIGYARIKEVDRVLADVGLGLIEITAVGAVSRRQGVSALSRSRRQADRVLPVFFIGACAAVAEVPLLTRDPRPYRTYFAGINLIASNEIEPR